MILFDFLTFEDTIINGGMLYTFSVFQRLCKTTKDIIGVCDNPNRINPRIKRIIDENGIKITSIRDGLDAIVKDNGVDVFFVGIAQRYNSYDLSSLDCKIVIVCHDICDVVTYYTGSFYDLDQRHFYFSLHSKHPFVARMKFIVQNWIAFRKPYGMKVDYKKLREGLGYKKFSQLLAQTNVYVITVSQYSRTSIQYYFDDIANPIEVFFPTSCQIETPSVSAESNILSRITKPYFLLMGGDRLNKNVYNATKAFERFNHSHKDAFELIVVGKTYRPIALDGVVQVGQVESKTLEVLYDNAHAFIYPSIGEGFGLPPLEAMSHKTPVLASFDTSIPEVCGDSAIYFNPYYREDIFKAMNVVLDERIRQEYIGKGLRRRQEIERKIEEDTDRLIRFILEKANER